MDIYYLVNLAHTVSAKFGVSTSSKVLDFWFLVPSKDVILGAFLKGHPYFC